MTLVILILTIVLVVLTALPRIVKIHEEYGKMRSNHYKDDTWEAKRKALKYAIIVTSRS